MKALRDTIQQWLAQEWQALRAPILWMGIGVIIIVATISAQLPHQHVIDVGLEEGIGNADLPFLRDFNTAEESAFGNFRWSGGESKVILPTFGNRPTLIELRWLPLSESISAQAPTGVEVWSNQQLIAELPVSAVGSRQWLYIPAAGDGHLYLRLVSDVFQPAQDPRQLGLPLERIVIVIVPGGWVWPVLPPLLWWLGAIVLGWLILHRTLLRWAGYGLAIGVGVVSLALILDPARWAFGAEAAFIALALTYPLTLAVQAGLRALAIGEAGSSLSAIVAIAFATRIGGRFYPASMPGDIGFHTNRFHEALGGFITVISKNRGIDFPYPPGPYLLLAPARVLGFETPLLLQIGAALADSLSAILIYLIARRVLPSRPALLAAAIYVFTAATYLTTWWSFDTHIITQSLYLLLIWGVIRAWEEWQAGQCYREWTLGLAALSAMVFLGHFGFLISSGALLGMLLSIVWSAGWLGTPWARRICRPLTIAIAGGAIFAIVFFYSAYLPMFLAQLDTARSGGLTAVAGRPPISRAALWNTLWQAGLIAHYGFFPIPFAIGGLWLLYRRQGWQITTGLMGLSFVVALIFATLPFITQISNSPRYLMALGWVVATGCAAACDALWRRGWAGRLGVLGAGLLVMLNTLWYWLTPMLWRARPPEPF
ncbi:hypothetical protein [Chloroflexus sp.]|uniref:hypothetical protein n=1 Tax=Chloroflexus sp. TaxID=1904827 RepID=UPI00404A82F2